MIPSPDIETVTGHTAMLRAAGASHVGRMRDHNEDRFHCDAGRGLFLVIDGVGGHAAGEVAAGLALEVIVDRLRRKTGSVEERLREAIALANNEIHRQAQAESARRGMACVLTAAVVENGAVTLGHVGDTRLYRIRGGQIEKITNDHSPVGAREDAGEITEQEAMRHPRRNEIFRDVGSAPRDPHDKDFIEIRTLPWSPDAAFLLCTDGLTDLVPSTQIRHVVYRNAGQPERTVHELIDLANRAGGKDNITVIVVEGERFGQPVEELEDEPVARPAPPDLAPIPQSRPMPKPAPSRSALVGRWAFFVYGLLAGLLLLSLLQGFLANEVDDGAEETPPTARTLVVSSEGYATIAAALAAAQAGDVVEVAPGAYPETVRMKEGVSLVSAVPGQAYLTGASGDTVAVVAEGVRAGRLAGFRIEPADGAALDVGLLLRGADVTVEQLEVSGTTRAAIFIDSTAAPTLRANYLHGNVGDGVFIDASASPVLENNVIVNDGGRAVSVDGARAEGFRQRNILR